jgi:hypothetical protein
MSSLRRPLAGWIAAAGTLALVTLAVLHERREERRFAELAQRIDELRLLSAMGREARDLRAILPSAGGDELAERVAQRVLAATAQGGRAAAAMPAGDTPAAAEPPRPRTPEQQTLVTQAQQIAEGALRGGQLRRSDVIELRDIFSRVGEGAGAEQRQLRDRIVQAINDQKLTIEDPAFVLF